MRQARNWLLRASAIDLGGFDRPARRHPCADAGDVGLPVPNAVALCTSRAGHGIYQFLPVRHIRNERAGITGFAAPGASGGRLNAIGAVIAPRNSLGPRCQS